MVRLKPRVLMRHSNLKTNWQAKLLLSFTKTMQPSALPLCKAVHRKEQRAAKTSRSHHPDHTEEGVRKGFRGPALYHEAGTYCLPPVPLFNFLRYTPPKCHTTVIISTTIYRYTVPYGDIFYLKGSITSYITFLQSPRRYRLLF